jgi:beta-lactamase class A
MDGEAQDLVLMVHEARLERSLWRNRCPVIGVSGVNAYIREDDVRSATQRCLISSWACGLNRSTFAIQCLRLFTATIRLRGNMLIKHFFCVLFVVSIAASQTSTPSAEKRQVLWQKLEANILEVDRHLDGVMGVAIEDPSTGEHTFLHENEVFAQASSIKITILAELYRQAQRGKLNLADLYTVQSSDLVPDSDIMGGLTPGVTRVTLRDLATMMVAVSDNSATNVLIDRVGMDNVNDLMNSLGLPHTRLRRKMMDLKAAKEGRENISTPKEMTALLEAIYHGEFLNKANTDDFFKVLGTGKSSWIPRELPADVRVADKPGSLEGLRNDSGIVFVEGRPFVICVMTSFLSNEREGEDAISKISLAAWRMFDRLSRASEYGRVVSPGNGVR